MDSPIAVVDIDGVLADARHRQHHVQVYPKNWDAFFRAAPYDEPLPEGFAVVRELASRYEIVYLSGRPERIREATQRWLTKHDAPGGRLVLRKDHDRRPARVMKLAALRKLAKQHEIAVVVDDEPEVCETFQTAGFQTFQATWANLDDARPT
jgi:phosphoglycolate phosphatase-like HAD superfamily hydrolase